MSDARRSASTPPLVILALMSLNVTTASTALSLGSAAALLTVDLLGLARRGHHVRPRTARDQQTW
jgi:hypothetical protein